MDKVAESGAADWSNIAIERIQKRAKEVEAVNDDTIANFVSGIVRESRCIQLAGLRYIRRLPSTIGIPTAIRAPSVSLR